MYLAVVMTQKTTINRIVSLRGVAVLGVIVMHILAITTGEVNALIELVYKTGRHGVYMFFTISGFILPYSLHVNKYKLSNFFRFLLKRSTRIDPPYWISILLFFTLCPLPLGLLSFKSIFLHISYLVPFVHGAKWYDGIFWTLSVEFQFYVLLGLSFPFLMKAPSYVTITLLILLSALSLHFEERDLIISRFYPFVFGYFAFMAYTKQISELKILILILSLAIYIVFMRSMLSGMVPSFTALVIIFFKQDTKIPILHFIGKISYSIYLIHLPVSIFATRLLSTVVNPGIILFLICFSLSIILTYFFNLGIENPAIRWSKRIKLQHQPNPAAAIAEPILKKG